MIEYAANLCEDEVLTPELLPETLHAVREKTVSVSETKLNHNAKDQKLLELLEKYGYTLEGKKQIADELHISLRTLYRRISRLQMCQDESSI